ncbi:MAG TPA: dockerin type I domain-containing protein [Candidatus Binatia bacterium]|nr:dockerin type I domain-containing protein [Candidatus Binatia bacterium]
MVAAAPEAHAGQAERDRCYVTFNLGALSQSTLGAVDFVVQYARPKIFWRDPENVLRCVGLPEGSAVAADEENTGPTSGELTVSFSSPTGVSGGRPLVLCEVWVPAGSVPAASDFPQITVTQAFDINQSPYDPVPVMQVGQVGCGEIPITTTTTSTTTTTHLPISTTTTTLAPETCSVLFRLQTAGSFRRVQFTVDYSDAGGELPQSPAVSCHNQTSAMLGATGNAQNRTLSLNLQAVEAFTGPRDLVECDFVPVDFIADSNAFDVDVTAASDANNTPIPVGSLPAVTASDVMCPSLTTTTTLGPTTTTTTVTTTSTTSTTLEPTCGDANNDGQIQASDALAALREAVGLESPCTPARCDTDDSGSITASDALRILRAAVGGNVDLDCPA